MTLTFGEVTPAIWGFHAKHVAIKFLAAEDVSTFVDDLEVSAAPFGALRVVLDGVRISLRGDPGRLFAALRNAWAQGADGTGTGFVWKGVDVEYRHRLWGRLSLRQVEVGVEDKIDGRVADRKLFRVRARQLTLGGRSWSDVALTVGKIKQMLQVDIGDAALPSAGGAVRFMVFDAVGPDASWLLEIGNQPAGPLLRRVGLHSAASLLDDTRVGGTVSFSVPLHESQQPVRGNIQLILDRWPAPAWPEVEALLGASGSFLGRFTTASNPGRWLLDYIEVTLPLFSLRGTGVLDVGGGPQLRFDVAGETRCRVLGTHLPPSQYRDRVAAYLGAHPATTVQPNNAAPPPDPSRGDSAALRLQIDIENAAADRGAVSWALQPGCGLAPLSVGAFSELELPPIHLPPAAGVSHGH